MEGFAFRAYIPALNGEVLRAKPIKNQYFLYGNLHCPAHKRATQSMPDAQAPRAAQPRQSIASQAVRPAPMLNRICHPPTNQASCNNLQSQVAPPLRDQYQSAQLPARAHHRTLQCGLWRSQFFARPTWTDTRSMP